MAQAKLAQFEGTSVQLAEFAKALSHPARIAILRALAERNMCVCGEIVEILPLAQSTVSQHLRELKRVGLIKGEIEGPKSCYCINWNTLESLFELLETLKDDLKHSEKCC